MSINKIYIAIVSAVIVSIVLSFSLWYFSPSKSKPAVEKPTTTETKNDKETDKTDKKD